ncbi:MAG: type III-B CRISPR module RAMP protein Cmr6 [Planctomycetaceae bacterium]
MSKARRIELPEPSAGHHPGLIIDRYLADLDDKSPSKATLYTQAVKAMKSDDLQKLYKAVWERFNAAMFPGTLLMHFKYNRASKLVVGLGNQNVLEAGLALHRTYGVPWLPGSALKGLAAHVAHQVWGSDDEAWRVGGEKHAVLFGRSSTEHAESAGGLVQFHDGLPKPEAIELFEDVLTPHHSEWNTSPDEKIVPATDFDSPIPVSFLAFQAPFTLAVSKRDPRLPDIWLKHAEQLLKIGLTTEEWGIGAKTNAGYGLLTFDKSEVVSAQASTSAAIPAASGGQAPAKLDTRLDAKQYREGDSIKVSLKAKTGPGNWRAIIEGSTQEIVIRQGDMQKVKNPKEGQLLNFRFRKSPVNWTQLELDYLKP